MRGCAMWPYVVKCSYALLHLAMLGFIATLSNALLSHATSCNAVPSYALARVAMISYVQLCYAMLSHAQLCLMTSWPAAGKWPPEATFRIDLYADRTSLGQLLGNGLRMPLFV